jgi:hypothetical protein
VFYIEYSYSKQAKGALGMVACPKCGNVVTKPEKELENSLFYLAAYICDKCGKHFLVDHKQSSELFWGTDKSRPEYVARKVETKK